MLAAVLVLFGMYMYSSGTSGVTMGEGGRRGLRGTCARSRGPELNGIELAVLLGQLTG